MFSFLLTILLTIVIIVIGGYLYLIWNFGYWKKRDVIEAKSKALIGSFPHSINQKKNLIYDMEEIYNQYKNKENFVGVFLVRDPQLLLLEPALAHEIFVAKFKYFHDNAHSAWIDKDVDEILGNNPFFLKGEEWKEKRAEIAPAITASRVKASYPIIQHVCEQMSNYIKKLLITSTKECNLDGKDLANRFTAQVVCDSIYGFDAGCFTESNSQILIEAKILIDNFVNTFMLKFIASVIPLVKFFLKPRFMSVSSTNFFNTLLKNAIEVRQNSKVDRADFLNYLLQLKEKKNLTEIEMVTHSVSFFGDGYETSATLISHCLLCLARNKSIQQQLREEILINLDDDDTLNFDKLNEMDYLEQCIQETLRLFSPVTFLSKVCTQSVELENTRGRSLKMKVGEVINIPIYLLHRDERNFPNPDEFIPERFSKENGGAKKYRDEGKFLPFGDGPRICLGQRFGITQTKAAICEIIRNFEITPNKKTRKDNYICPRSLMTLLDGGIWLNFKEIKN